MSVFLLILIAIFNDIHSYDERIYGITKLSIITKTLYLYDIVNKSLWFK